VTISLSAACGEAHAQALLGHGQATAAALTGGFQWALWVSGLTALAAAPVILAQAAYLDERFHPPASCPVPGE